MEEGRPLVRREFGDALKIKRDRRLERTEDVLERTTLYGNVEVEADRLPVAIASLGIATQGSGCQFRLANTELRLTAPADHM